nr:hypothetical protein [Tanacetum cinerariifolium]
MENLIQDNNHLEERLDGHGSRLYTLKNLDIPQQNRFKDLLEADMKEILHQRIWETNSYKAYEDHMKKRHDSPKTPPGSLLHQPPPPLPPAGPSRTLRSLGDFGSSQLPPLPPLLSTCQNLHMDDDTAPDEQLHSSDDEDIGNAHIPEVNLQQDWWKPLKESKPAIREPA